MRFLHLVRFFMQILYIFSANFAITLAIVFLYTINPIKKHKTI